TSSNGAGRGSNGPSVVSPLTSHWTWPGSTSLPAGKVVPRITRSACFAIASSFPRPFWTVATHPPTNATAATSIATARCNGLDVLEHRRIVRAPALGRKDVHLPRIVVQHHTPCYGDTFALVHERVDEVAEIGLGALGGEVRIVRQPGQGGDTVDGCIEDQLRP